jgi:hypothetical protein
MVAAVHALGRVHFNEGVHQWQLNTHAGKSIYACMMGLESKDCSGKRQTVLSKKAVARGDVMN